MKVRNFRFVSDPGHGYLRVPLEVLKEYGVMFKISPYSFKSDKFAYLEEDCDMTTFVDAVREVGDDVKFKVSYTNNDASCRRYPRFPETMGYVEYRKEKYGF